MPRANDASQIESGKNPQEDSNAAHRKYDRAVGFAQRARGAALAAEREIVPLLKSDGFERRDVGDPGREGVDIL